ncbi:isocitrate lyase/phosphoenolpyruvate mutase family protein [Sphingosinicella sp. BN140058]|uniref:isocitrate lyase/PEP mutase family protein n=1 Tax=Sphingosinicella sp. BN140058 TaxID=1892855 RepID=UPI0010135BF1|nr:isocitrate lyase/phosphoenolpyruvate mutase family protein [Sphingosinicella sp. BN140058]QAY77313.1 isocitrate lyase/phosphoenolpyruvate mutase family protein [Sphingosinicella sp. BN140058]
MSVWGEKARAFAALHRRGDPLILFNIWDAGSARIVAAAGARAIATGSWSVAEANGYGDGEQVPIDFVLGNTARIANAVELPVTIDFEGGYAEAPDDVAANVAALAAAGAIGCNFEDRIVGGDGLHALARQAERIAAIVAAAPDGFFVNARTDVFLSVAHVEHPSRMDEALERAQAYADAGAKGLFVPGLSDERLIERMCAESPLPVNIMVWPGTTPPLGRLAELGAARISHAGAPWRVAMQALAEPAAAAHRGEG